VEAWTRRDHAAEWKQWEGWLATIRESVSAIPTVRTEVLQPSGPSNYAPQLQVSWDAQKVGITGTKLADELLNGNPRIILAAGHDSFTVMPYMMMPGDDKLVAPRIREVLSNPPMGGKITVSAALAAKVNGQWDVEIAYTRDHAAHTLFLEQTGDQLMGSHRGEFLTAEVRGKVEGAKVRCRSSHHYEGTSIGYVFEGVAEGDTIHGTVDVGEYGKAPFTARRHFHA